MAKLPALYNTLTRQTELLEPIEPGKVGIYCCGPTVYDVPHAGHARAALAPDLLVRRLRSLGLSVKYVRNITDVDDKILERAEKNGEPPLELSKRMAEVYQQQMRQVGCLDPDHEPRVSEHLEQIYALVHKLVARGAAYVVELEGGKKDVYFSVRSFPGYGKLSRRKLDELVAGARVATSDVKRDPLDFALWKGAAAGEWGWESPWGRGRPGWHIECSAMCSHYLGQPFDVHAGGMDLIFPHHENEIAQSEAAEPERGALARLWMHNGFVSVDKEKMSKSLGNFVTVSDVFARNDPEGFRWFLLGAHYRGPIQFDTEKLPDGRVVFPGVDEAERRVDYLFGAVARMRQLLATGVTASAKLPPELAGFRDQADQAMRTADTALDDDLNTPVALASLGELAKLGNELVDLAQKRKKDQTFLGAVTVALQTILTHTEKLARGLGLLQATPAEYFARVTERRLRLRSLTAESIEARIAERAQARKDKDYARGDAIRKELEQLGVTIKDSPEGTTWTIAQ